jgi:hypothetical protein
VLRKSFNSATALMPWMTIGKFIPLPAVELLQFGHGVDAVDDSSRWKWLLHSQLTHPLRAGGISGIVLRRSTRGASPQNPSVE